MEEVWEILRGSIKVYIEEVCGRKKVGDVIFLKNVERHGHIKVQIMVLPLKNL